MVGLCCDGKGLRRMMQVPWSVSAAMERAAQAAWRSLEPCKGVAKGNAGGMVGLCGHGKCSTKGEISAFSSVRKLRTKGEISEISEFVGE